MLGPVGVPAIFEHIVGKPPDSIEISVGVGWVWEFSGGADGDRPKKQNGENKPMCTFLCHIVTSQILSQSVHYEDLTRPVGVHYIKRYEFPQMR